MSRGGMRDAYYATREKADEDLARYKARVAAQDKALFVLGAPVDVTYLADTVILLRYFEAVGSVDEAQAAIGLAQAHGAAGEDGQMNVLSLVFMYVLYMAPQFVMFASICS